LFQKIACERKITLKQKKLFELLFILKPEALSRHAIIKPSTVIVLIEVELLFDWELEGFWMR
jgi:hypothetical protein